MRESVLIWVSLAIVICNLYLLGTGRLRSMIRGVALQGFLLGVLPILLPHRAQGVHTAVLIVIGITIKGFAIPYFLSKAVQGVSVTREASPSVGYSVSVLYGILTSGFAFYVLRSLPLQSAVVSPLHASIAIGAAFTGIFLIVARRNAVAQVIGYLVFENSAYILGVSMAANQPWLVEMGVLMDMLVGVFIMVVVIGHIHAEHDTLSTKALEKLAQ